MAAKMHKLHTKEATCCRWRSERVKEISIKLFMVGRYEEKSLKSYLQTETVRGAEVGVWEFLTIVDKGGWWF